MASALPGSAGVGEGVGLGEADGDGDGEAAGWVGARPSCCSAHHRVFARRKPQAPMRPWQPAQRGAAAITICFTLLFIFLFDAGDYIRKPLVIVPLKLPDWAGLGEGLALGEAEGEGEGDDGEAAGSSARVPMPGASVRPRSTESASAEAAVAASATGAMEMTICLMLFFILFDVAAYASGCRRLTLDVKVSQTGRDSARAGAWKMGMARGRVKTLGWDRRMS